jgi:hypothetical protein
LQLPISGVPELGDPVSTLIFLSEVSCGHPAAKLAFTVFAKAKS